MAAVALSVSLTRELHKKLQVFNPQKYGSIQDPTTAITAYKAEVLFGLLVFAASLEEESREVDLKSLSLKLPSLNNIDKTQQKLQLLALQCDWKSKEPQEKDLPLLQEYLTLLMRPAKL